MKIEFSKDSKTFLAGCVTMFVLCIALGADKAPVPAMPEYSVYASGPTVNIVNNRTNTLYIYVNRSEVSVLHGIIDLEDTGKPEIKAKKPDGQTEI